MVRIPGIQNSTDTSEQQRPTIHSYSDWFKDKFQIELYAKPSSIYQYVIQKLMGDFENCDLWKEFEANINNYNDEYRINKGYPLLKIEPLIISAKPYKSLINKCYRKNILLNANYPEPPINGWISPANWFIKINDLLRTTMTVRYLDGVEFMVSKIQTLTNKYKFSFDVNYEAREEGYYAAHITIAGKFSIVDNEWNVIEVNFPFEIQITTQLQEVIKSLLHKMYEEIRVLPKIETSNKWQWDYKSREFRSNYLGHILHYIEGMILEVRDKQKNIKG